MATLQSYLTGVIAHLAVSPVVAALWAARFAQRSGYRNCYAKPSVSLFEFAQQLLLQMSPRSLVDRATLGGYPLLLCLTFAPCSRLHRLRHVPDLGPQRPDISLFWFCVRIHKCLALPVSQKITGTAACRAITLS